MSRAKVTLFAVWGCLAVVVLLASRVAATEAGDLCAADANPCTVTTAKVVDDLSVIDVRPRDLVIDVGGSLSVGSGEMTIKARRLTVAPASTSPSRAAGALLAQGNGSSDGGTITVEADEMTIAGRIDVSGASGGALILRSNGSLSVTGAVTADSRSSDGVGGRIEMMAAVADIVGSVIAQGASLGFGGDVAIYATGNLTVSGSVDVTAGDGGDIELGAGHEMGSGNLLLTETSRLEASGKQEGYGGGVDIEADGNGVASGHVTMNGAIAANGGSASIGAGDGGMIAVTAKGDVIADNNEARLVVEGGKPDGFGGEIEIVAVNGAVNLMAAITVGAPGVGASTGGGDLSVDAFAEITIGGSIDGKGGSDVIMTSTNAGLTVSDSGSIDAGAGGSIDLTAGLIETELPEQMVIAGSLTANGGVIELTGTDLVELGGSLTVDGVSGGGDGGSIDVIAEEGPVLVSGGGTLSAKARGNGFAGGSLSFEAGTLIRVEGRLDASGAGGRGGKISLDGLSGVVVSGTLLASTVDAGHGGEITIISDAADVYISGDLTSSGGPREGGAGGVNTVQGCEVTIAQSGQLQTLRANGINRVIGRAATVVFGSLQADAETGKNEFRYRNATAVPFFNADSSVIPDPTLVVDSSLAACGECGNGTKELSEECDDGNQIDGDGCSQDCQVEGRGDANGNGILDSDDPDALIEEIFDGDGDRVEMVASPEGTFRGGAGADANGDRVVSAADLTAITTLFATTPQ